MGRLKIARCGDEWYGDIWNDGSRGAFGQTFIHDCGLPANHQGTHRCRTCGLTPETSWAHT
jgi:hypothetical protein